MLVLQGRAGQGTQGHLCSLSVPGVARHVDAQLLHCCIICPAIPPCPAATTHRLSPITIWLMPDSMIFWCSAGTPVTASSLERILGRRAGGVQSR